MKEQPTPELIKTSVSVRLEVSGCGVNREEAFLYFDTEWRGSPAAVTMQASRYTYARQGNQQDDWSPWVIYASAAEAGSWRETIESDYRVGRGGYLTDTAKKRLSDQCEPIVRKWLGGTNYLMAKRDAVFYAVKNLAHDFRPYSDPTWRFRDTVDSLREDLTQERQDYLTEIADAYDKFAELYQEGSES